MTHTPSLPIAVVRGRAISPEIWAAAMAMYANAPATAVSAAFGMSVQAIYNYVVRNKCGKKKGGAPRKRVVIRMHHPQETWDQIEHDYVVKGYTAPQLAEHYKVTIHAIKGRARRGGWRKVDAPRTAPDVLPSLHGAPPEDLPTAAEASSAWRARAHPAQLPPEGAWRTWLFQGGRGAGKTRAGAEWVADFAARHGDARIALVGAAMRDVREVMVEGPSGLANLPDRPAPRFEAGRQRLVFASGAVAYAFSSQEPERLRGPQFDAAWADEFCAWARPEYTLQMLRLGLRLGADPRLVVTTTPKPMAELRRLRGEASCVTTQAGTIANAHHLAPAFVEGLNEIYGGTRFAAQELDGVLVESDGGALWRAQDLAGVRGHAPPACDAVIVAVDPPVGADGAACGIIVAGRVGRRGYVLADRSARGLSPLGWAQRACAAAVEFSAQRIVAEANQGGAMVRAMLASAGAPCAVELVHATDAKCVRAAPAAALYEQGRITHCGDFVALEEEMMALSREEGEGLRIGLRDRVDALVWALTALLVNLPPPPAGPRVRRL